MKKYEITFVVGENFTEDKAKEIAKEVSKLITERGGKIEKDVFWEKRKLTYKIAKNSFGYYFLIIFDIDPSQNVKITRELNLNEKILRYILVDFIEDSPFFEEGDGERKSTRTPRKAMRGDMNEEQEIKKTKRPESSKAISQKEIEEIMASPADISKEEEIKEEEKAEDIKEDEKVEQQVEEIAKEEAPIEKQPKDEAREKTETEEDKSSSASISAEASNDKKAAEDKEVIERKPERRRMTEDERKAQLEKKLAELLKDEEE